MSISSLYSFQSKVRTEESVSYEIKSDLKSLSRSLNDSMDDRVGQSASDSILGILNAYSTAADDVINRCNNAAYTLEGGYTKLEGLANEGERLLSNAEKLVKELGDFK